MSRDHAAQAGDSDPAKNRCHSEPASAGEEPAVPLHEHRLTPGCPMSRALCETWEFPTVHSARGTRYSQLTPAKPLQENPPASASPQSKRRHIPPPAAARYLPPTESRSPPP